MIPHDPDAPCDLCDNPLGSWDYRYRGKHYCRSCYDRHFVLKTCVKCGKKKMIHTALETPVCKICQIKDKPCIRCGREITRFGKITEQGPVCASCAPYFLPPKQCPICHEYSHTVFRSEINGKLVECCAKCLNKTRPTCSLCNRKKVPYTHDENGKPICKKCATEERECTQCGESMPAGRGRICLACSSRNALDRKVRFGKNSLSDHYRDVFVEFSEYLVENRGIEFASFRLMYFFRYFKDLDEIAEELGRRPRYQEIVNALQVATTRTYLTATYFFHERGYLEIDKAFQETAANLDMIDRYRHAFKTGTHFHEIIEAYYAKYEERLQEEKTTIRSMRLALTPAVKLLKFCEYHNVKHPTRKIVENYLWCFWGQRNAVYSFVNFLNDHYGLPMRSTEIAPPVLTSPNESRKYLKQRLISAMRYVDIRFMDTDTFLRLAIGYLQGIGIPKGIRLTYCPIKKDKDGYFMRFAGNRIHITEEAALIAKEYAEKEKEGRQSLSS